MKFEIINLLFLIHYAAASGIINSIPEDGKLNFTQLAKKYGYQCEEYDVTTKDGFILKVFHIKGNKYGTPILACHGNADSADTYILTGNNSLAITLANEGYDAWYMNVRGTSYSRRHVTLDPDRDADFWDWSYYEIGVIDLPLVVDFVLEKTKKEKLVYIAHSLGTTISYVCNSMLEEYNEKFKLCISMAPFAFLSNVPSQTMLFGKLFSEVNPIFKATGFNEIGAGNPILTTAFQTVCSVKFFGYEICFKILFQTVTGTKPSEVPPELFQVVLGHFPKSTSRKNIEHLTQTIRDKRFARFDYGSVKNMKLYGSLIAPDYPLEKITAPFALYVATEDALADPKDARILQSRLSNSNVTYHEFPDKGHVDFVWGKHMQEFLYPTLLKQIQDFSR